MKSLGNLTLHYWKWPKVKYIIPLQDPDDLIDLVENEDCASYYLETEAREFVFKIPGVILTFRIK